MINMRQDLDVLIIALRVLTAAVEYQDPDPADVASLRLKAPQSQSLPADQLACDIIQRMAQQSAARRRARSHSA